MFKTLFIIFFVYQSVYCAPPVIIAIAGGSGSGKSTIMKEIAKQFPDSVTTISQDDYYKDLSYLSEKERAQTNFDHPDSIEFSLLKEHLKSFKQGNSVRVPCYDFSTHIRSGEKLVLSSEIIIVEGLLLLTDSELRDLFDYKIFIETDADLRFIRRVQRDLLERSRTIENIIHQYEQAVRPMYISFVEPSKRFADLIIPWNNYNKTALQFVTNAIKEKI
jgi:uridine kinase